MVYYNNRDIGVLKMMLARLIVAGVFIFSIIAYNNVWGMSPQESLTKQLELISANRNSDEFLSLTILIFGPPDKMFRHSGCDVWFYPKLSTSLADEPLKNVYLFIKKGEIISIKTFSQNLNPYTDFETYP